MEKINIDKLNELEKTGAIDTQAASDLRQLDKQGISVRWSGDGSNYEYIADNGYSYQGDLGKGTKKGLFRGANKSHKNISDAMYTLRSMGGFNTKLEPKAPVSGTTGGAQAATTTVSKEKFKPKVFAPIDINIDGPKRKPFPTITGTDPGQEAGVPATGGSYYTDPSYAKYNQSDTWGDLARTFGLQDEENLSPEEKKAKIAAFDNNLIKFENLGHDSDDDEIKRVFGQYQEQLKRLNIDENDHWYENFRNYAPDNYAQFKDKVRKGDFAYQDPGPVDPKTGFPSLVSKRKQDYDGGYLGEGAGVGKIIRGFDWDTHPGDYNLGSELLSGFLEDAAIAGPKGLPAANANKLVVKNFFRKELMKEGTTLVDAMGNAGKNAGKVWNAAKGIWEIPKKVGKKIAEGTKKQVTKAKAAYHEGNMPKGGWPKSNVTGPHQMSGRGQAQVVTKNATPGTQYEMFKGINAERALGHKIDAFPPALIPGNTGNTVIANQLGIPGFLQPGIGTSSSLPAVIPKMTFKVPPLVNFINSGKFPFSLPKAGLMPAGKHGGRLVPKFQAGSTLTRTWVGNPSDEEKAALLKQKAEMKAEMDAKVAAANTTSTGETTTLEPKQGKPWLKNMGSKIQDTFTRTDEEKATAQANRENRRDQTRNGQDRVNQDRVESPYVKTGVGDFGKAQIAATASHLALMPKTDLVNTQLEALPNVLEKRGQIVRGNTAGTQAKYAADAANIQAGGDSTGDALVNRQDDLSRAMAAQNIKNESIRTNEDKILASEEVNRGVYNENQGLKDARAVEKVQQQSMQNKINADYQNTILGMKAANRSDLKHTAQNLFREGAHNQEVNVANSITEAQNAYASAMRQAELMPQTSELEIQAYNNAKLAAEKALGLANQRYGTQVGTDGYSFKGDTTYGVPEAPAAPATPAVPNGNILGMLTPNIGNFDPMGTQPGSNYA